MGRSIKTRQHVQIIDIADEGRAIGKTPEGEVLLVEGALPGAVVDETEQVFFNDVLGLPYEQASKGPDWEKLRDRVETAPEAKFGACVEHSREPESRRAWR